METQTVVNHSQCKHATAESIGSDSSMVFLRCLACRAVLISEGGRIIAIPAAPPAQGN